MPRIVIDARSVLPRTSGIGNYVAALIRHLIPLATDVEYLLLRHPDQAPLCEHARVKEIVFPGETKSMSTVFRLGYAHPCRDFDLYHAPADLVPLGLACPWVVTVHDLMWVEARQLASAFLPVRWANSAWYTFNIGRAVRGARRVIAISEATRAALQRVYPREGSKVDVVHHGIDLERYQRAPRVPASELAATLGIAGPFSLIVGQGSPYKNHLGMVRAFVEATRDQPDHKLVLVRRFSRVDGEMQALLARPDVRAKVSVHAFVEERQLAGLYQHAQALLFASHYEGFGLPALEAMAIGLPVLASTTPALLEVTGDAALHAEAGDHADLVRKLRQLLLDLDLRRELIAAGRRRVATFTWEQAARKTLAVYRQAIGA